MKQSFFEQSGGTYTRVGDYLIPDLVIEESEQRLIGKYGRMRKRYLKEHRPVLYSNLLTTGKLYRHLAEIDVVAREDAEDAVPRAKNLAELPALFRGVRRARE